MKKLESEILQMASQLIENHLQYIDPPFAVKEPEILVISGLSNLYTSKLSIEIYRNIKFYDLIEFLIYVNGEPLISR